MPTDPNGPIPPEMETAPAARERRSQPICHATDSCDSISARRPVGRRPLPQENHADLGIVDDGRAVGS